MYLIVNYDDWESERNDTIEKAYPLSEKTFLEAELPTGDTDYYKIHLAAPSLVDVAYVSHSQTADVRIEVYDQAGQKVASAISQNGASAFLPLGLPTGDYFLKVSTAGDIDESATYLVSYKIMGALPNKGVVPLPVNETKSGAIYRLTDYTDFTFTLSQEQTVKILFTPESMTRIPADGHECGPGRHGHSGLPPASARFNRRHLSGGRYTLRVTPVETVDAENSFHVQLLANTQQVEKGTE